METTSKGSEKSKPASSTKFLYGYMGVDLCITIVLFILSLVNDPKKYHSTDWERLTPAIWMALGTWHYCLALMIESSAFLSIYTLRLLLLAIVSAMFGISRFFLDTAWTGVRILETVASLLFLLPFFAVGVLHFVYKTLNLVGNYFGALQPCRGYPNGREDSPIPTVVLILYTVADFLVATSTTGLYFYRTFWIGIHVDSVLPLLVLSLASLAWFAGFVGIVCKDNVFLRVYLARLVLMAIAAAVWGFSRFFLTTAWPGERENVMLACLGILLPFYVLGMSLYGLRILGVPKSLKNVK